MTKWTENRIEILKKNQKGNILIMVILVMLTASMLGLLSASFLKEMFSYTINLDGYYKSYYLSKAGIELALTEIDNSDFGFSNTITGNNNIFTQNLCPGSDCSVNMKIIGRSWMISEEYRSDSSCNSGNAFKLQSGESFVLPLFYQADTGSNASIITGFRDYVYLTGNSILAVNADSSLSPNVNIQLVNQDMTQDNLYITSCPINNIGCYFENRHISNINGKSYLMISNPEGQSAISFCLTNNQQLPATKFYIVSLGNYQGKYVGMQAIFAQPIPKFMLY